MIKGKFNFKELERYSKQLEKLSKQSNELHEFCRLCAKEIAAKLLSLVISKTQVAKPTYYIDSDGKQKVMKEGGTLRRGWVARTEKEAESGSKTSISPQEVIQYVNSLNITKEGNIYTIEIVNPVHYASYYENGHRQEVGRYVPAIGKRLVNRWVDGKFVLRDSEIMLDAKTPEILERKITKFMEECFNGD